MILIWIALFLPLALGFYMFSFVNTNDPNRTEKKQELLKKLDTPSEKKKKNKKRRKQVNNVVLPKQKAVANTIGDFDPFEEAASASSKKDQEAAAAKSSKKSSKKKKKQKKQAAAAEQAAASKKSKKQKKQAAAPSVSYAQVAEEASHQEEEQKKKSKKRSKKQKKQAQNEELVANLHSNSVMTSIAPTESLSKEDSEGFITVTDKKSKSLAQRAHKKSSSNQNNTTTTSDGWNIVGAPSESKATTSTTPAATASGATNSKRRSNINRSTTVHKSSNLNYKPYANEADFWTSDPAPLPSSDNAAAGTTAQSADATAPLTGEPNMDLLKNTIAQKTSPVIKMYSGGQSAQGPAWSQIEDNGEADYLDSQDFPTVEEASTMPAPRKRRIQNVDAEEGIDADLQEAPEAEVMES